MHMDELIKRLIEESFNPVDLKIVNESHKHTGHPGDDGSGQTHYKLIIVSFAFDSLSRVERQRSVLLALDEAFKAGLHAVSMELSTP